MVWGCRLGRRGQLEQLHQTYMQLISFIKGIGLEKRKPLQVVIQDLREELKTLTNDSEFLQSGLRKSKEIYEKKGSKAIPQRAACLL